MPFPESTYRLQFHAGFTFRHAAAIVPYLHALGVTHCYASPYLKATPGSTHGYDVVDPTRLNPEVGTESDYDAWLDAMRRHGMSHILDTVPNHMGVGTNDNVWWNDVLEKGPASRYAHYFDIAWQGSPRPELHNKVLLPVLGAPYGQVLEKGELRLVFEDNKIGVAYYDRRFPISMRTFQQVPGGGGAAFPTAEQVASFNGTPGDPRSFDRLDLLLGLQSYRLCYWRVASDEINYRRFFDINNLAALRMERTEVFRDTHAFIFRLLAEGKVAGLRIDHPDGLYDPREYFERLQLRYAGSARDSEDAEEDDEGTARRTDALRHRPLYVVAEKILAIDEPLPEEWPCHGTSGYDFLIMANGLYVDGPAADAFTKLYDEWLGRHVDFEDLVYETKKLILKISLASELHMLAYRLDWIAQQDRYTRDFTHNGLRHALREVIACFPVYRSYVTRRGVHDSDRRHVERAVREASHRNPKTDALVFRFVGDVVLQNHRGEVSDEDREAWLDFAARFQQLTAPVTAKGIEDTAFYVYNRFVSLNEVGGEPARFGTSPAELHSYLQDRQKRWPHALSALSTHDTKRSEDVRARLNILSEIPDEWSRVVRHWRDLNAAHRRPVACGFAPSPNDEYLLYQTLVGAYPLEHGADDRATFVKRIQSYMEKATREAKVYTSWTSPNEEYEAGVKDFIARILDQRSGREFLDSFLPFQRRVSDWGLINSLSQTLLKLTAPGVPDIYQGTELWDFSLVDPDNRRPVDYARRRELLAGLKAQSDRPGLATELMRQKQDGRVKLYLTWQALACRRQHPGLFSTGEYLPIRPDGPGGDNVFAFARRSGEHVAVVAIPRLVTRPLDPDTRLNLPLQPSRPLRNVFTAERLDAGSGLTARDLFASFPVALLVNE